jgi:hypothetical protein
MEEGVASRHTFNTSQIENIIIVQNHQNSSLKIAIVSPDSSAVNSALDGVENCNSALNGHIIPNLIDESHDGESKNRDSEKEEQRPKTNSRWFWIFQ